LKDSSIAVLPFADMSPAKDPEYFSDGLTEELINDLAKVSGLKVVGRSSAFQFKGRNQDLRQVGRMLGVRNILEGSVRREGNRLRISAELIKADSTGLF
jgi:TolB-like protein